MKMKEMDIRRLKYHVLCRVEGQKFVISRKFFKSMGINLQLLIIQELNYNF